MGKISSYGTASAPSLGDKLIGTSVGGSPVNGTYNFTIQQLADLISGEVTLQNVLDNDNSATQNINLTGNITLGGGTGQLVSSFINSGEGSIQVLHSINTDLSNLTIYSLLKDSVLSPGTLGQVLSSTGTATRWVTLSTPTLQQVLDSNNIATQDINLNGTLFVLDEINTSSIKSVNATVHTNGFLFVGDAGASISYDDSLEKLIIKNIVSNGIFLQNSGSSLELLDNDISFNANGTFYFNVLGSQKMIIDDYGNIGLGTSVIIDKNPNRRIIQINATIASATVNLSVANVIYGTCTSSNTDYAILSRNNANLEIGTASIGGQVKFLINDSPKMILNTNGSLLINRSTSLASYYKLQVEGSVYVSGDINANLVGALSFQVYDTLFADLGIGTGIGIVGQYGVSVIATWDYNDSGDCLIKL